MNKDFKNRAVKLLSMALKIAVGSCISIYIAERMNLEFAASAGIITLLTIVTTKWETLKLSLYRIVTFFLCALICWFLFRHVQSEWIAYGLFVFILVTASKLAGLQATISVNAVIGTHFMQTLNFSFESVRNEFLLVLIGIFFAILFNLFHNNKSQKQTIVQAMRYTENQLQVILEELAAYLTNLTENENVWEDIYAFEKNLAVFTEQAYEYQNNTFVSHPSYYIHYFEMRTKQLTILHNLHYEIRKIRYLPCQAVIVADYIMYLKDFVVERNCPNKQLERLHALLEEMRKEELPKCIEEFESRAKLYHILMDLEDFLLHKKEFVESLDEKQLHVYWNSFK